MSMRISEKQELLSEIKFGTTTQTNKTNVSIWNSKLQTQKVNTDPKNNTYTYTGDGTLLIFHTQAEMNEYAKISGKAYKEKENIRAKAWKEKEDARGKAWKDYKCGKISYDKMIELQNNAEIKMRKLQDNAEINLRNTQLNARKRLGAIEVKPYK